MNPADHRIPFLTMVAGLATFVGFIALAMAQNGWHFEYPLDDVYIHLAMAEQISKGGYGVNAGEYSSAASSFLYPFLLVPFAGSDFQRWLPLIWNVVALGTASYLIGCAIAEANLGKWAWPVAVFAPFALNMHTVAYTGMENMAHGAVSLGIVLGLWRFIQHRRIGLMLIVCVILAPALRLEGVALAMAAGGVVVLSGHLRSGAGLIVLAIFPVTAFVVLLTQLGLDPLPNSVTSKLSISIEPDLGPLARLHQRFSWNLLQGGGRYLLILIVVMVLMLCRRPARPDLRWFCIAVIAAALAHMFAGSIGWMDRYESYLILAATAVVLVAPAMLTGFSRSIHTGIVVLVLAAGVFTYGPTMGIHLGNMRAIASQQGEMARFAKDFVKAPVAVNDLGYVAWRNPDYVLDLWGLASSSALTTRLSDPAPGWAAPLVEAADVRVVMIYDRWLGDARSDDWVYLGQLFLDTPPALMGGHYVDFYATDPNDVPALITDLRAWTENAPVSAVFSFAEGVR